MLPARASTFRSTVTASSTSRSPSHHRAIQEESILADLNLPTRDTEKLFVKWFIDHRVFKPYSGVGTAVLIFRKGGPTERVWFYELTADGFSLDDKRQAGGTQRHLGRAGEVAGAREGAALLLSSGGSDTGERPEPHGGPLQRR
jgi:hypothetical protein